MKVKVNDKEYSVENVEYTTEIESYSSSECWVDIEFELIKITIDKQSELFEFIYPNKLKETLEIECNGKKTEYFISNEMQQYLSKQLQDKDRQYIVVYFTGEGHEV